MCRHFLSDYDVADLDGHGLGDAEPGTRSGDEGGAMAESGVARIRRSTSCSVMWPAAVGPLAIAQPGDASGSPASRHTGT